MDSFEALRHNIIDLSLGPFNMVVVDQLIPAANNVFLSQQDLISINEGIIIDITKKPTEKTINYQLAEQTINSLEILPYANAIMYFSALHTESQHLTDAVQKNKEELKYKLIIKQFGKVVLGFLFTLLLINYLLFDHQDKKNKELNEQFRRNEFMISKISELSSGMQQKEQFIAQNDILQKSNLYYYADRIAYLLPASITLTRLQINSLQQKIKRNKVIAYTKNTISIEGYTRQSIQVNNWIDILKQEEWVKKVSILNYQKEQGKQTGNFNFDIEFFE